MNKIVLDPGHGGSKQCGKSTAEGTRFADGVSEKNVNMALSERIARHLGGASLTRCRDENKSLAERIALARRDQACTFVSLHTNPKATEVWVHDRAGENSLALGTVLRQALTTGYGTGVPEVRRGPLAVLSPDHHAPETAACLVDLGYGAALGRHGLEQSGRLDEVAAALGDAVGRFIAEPNPAPEGAPVGPDRPAPMVARGAPPGQPASLGSLSPRLGPGLETARSLSWDLDTAITRLLDAVDGAGELAPNQKSRLKCMLAKLRDPSVDDRYLNGYSYLLGTLGPRLNDEQFNVMMSHVRTDLLNEAAWTDPQIGTSLDLLDRRIFFGISYLNRQNYTQGAALAAAHLQLKDWIVGQQSNRNSIYYCYGEGQ
jgi:hypothetical protein